MGRAAITVKFEFPKYFNAIQESLPRIETLIASTIQTQVGLRFNAEGAHNGHEKWPGLKFRQGQILSLSGTLRKSMAPPAMDGRPGPEGFVNKQGNVMDLLVEVGSKLIYASTQNNGAIIRPKSKSALKFEAGGKIHFFKKVEIPARSFTDMNDQDTNELQESLANLVAEILESA